MHYLTKLVLSLAMLVSMQAYAEAVDINTADASTLASAIDGVGEKKAATIVAYRDAHGPFNSVDDGLLQINPGIRAQSLPNCFIYS